MKMNKFQRVYTKIISEANLADEARIRKPFKGNSRFKAANTLPTDLSVLQKCMDLIKPYAFKDYYRNWGDVIMSSPGEFGYDIGLYDMDSCPNREQDFINPSVCVTVLANMVSDYVNNLVEEGQIEEVPEQDLEVLENLHHYYEENAKEDYDFLVKNGIDKEIKARCKNEPGSTLADGSQTDDVYTYAWNGSGQGNY